MDPESMTREQLVETLKQLNEYMDNVVVFWGDKREMRVTFQHVADNRTGEYTAEEAGNARIILESEGAFDEFIELTRESFDRGGINYVLSERISALMQEVAARRAAH